MANDMITQVQDEVLHEQQHRDGIPQIAIGFFSDAGGVDDAG